MPYLAFVLDNDSRATLLERVPARHSRVIAHHVTLVPPNSCMSLDELKLVAESFSRLKGVSVLALHEIPGVQAVAVRVFNETKRDDGSFYHITVSVEPPHRPVESNNAKSGVPLLRFPLYGNVEILS